jgi:hypothetical protein
MWFLPPRESTKWEWEVVTTIIDAIPDEKRANHKKQDAKRAFQFPALQDMTLARHITAP